MRRGAQLLGGFTVPIHCERISPDLVCHTIATLAYVLPVSGRIGEMLSGPSQQRRQAGHPHDRCHRYTLVTG